MFFYSLKNSKILSKLSYLAIISPFIFIILRSLNSYQSSTIIKTFGNSLNLTNNVFLNFFLLNFLTILSPFLIITIIELIIKNRSNKRSNLSISFLNSSGGGRFADLWHFLFFLVEDDFPFILSLATIGLASFSSSFEKILEKLFSGFIISPDNEFVALILLIISFLVVDFLSYIEHRLAHKIPFIWDMHELHHSATEMTIFSNFRKTPFENLFLAPFTATFHALTAITIIKCISNGYQSVMIIYLLFNSFRVATMYLSHCSLKIIYPKPISYFLMSPSLHWIHHSDKPEHYDSNFGMIFPFWDILFKSYIGEVEIDNIKGYGVRNTLYNRYNPFYSHYLIPINKLIKRVKNV